MSVVRARGSSRGAVWEGHIVVNAGEAVEEASVRYATPPTALVPLASGADVEGREESEALGGEGGEGGEEDEAGPSAHPRTESSWERELRVRSQSFQQAMAAQYRQAPVVVRSMVERLDSTTQIPKAMASRQTHTNATRRRAATLQMLQRHGPRDSLERQLEEVPDYPPRFIWLVSLVQVIVLCCALITEGTVGWGWGHVNVERSVPTFNNHSTLLQYTVSHNLWYGPDTAGIVAYGAKYAACMRTTTETHDKSVERDEQEADWGCCVDAEENCGMMSLQNCTNYGGIWTNPGTPCSRIVGNGRCNAIVLRPCCYYVTNDCIVATKEFCDNLPNTHVWHDDKELCSEVNCFRDFCAMGSLGGSKPNQWWRFLTPVFMHVGVGHLALNLIAQIRLGADIESLAGFWKTGLMYICSAVGGNVLALLLDQDSFSCGASSAIYGLFGVMLVDFLQSWDLFDDPHHVLCLQVPQIILVLGLGTLPWFDNFAHIGGFAIGVISGYAFLPYIHFNSKDRVAKVLVSRGAKVATLAVFCAFAVLFYSARDPRFCSWCKYLNCVPYTPDLCDDVWP